MALNHVNSPSINGVFGVRDFVSDLEKAQQANTKGLQTLANTAMKVYDYSQSLDSAKKLEDDMNKRKEIRALRDEQNYIDSVMKDIPQETDYEWFKKQGLEDLDIPLDIDDIAQLSDDEYEAFIKEWKAKRGE